MWWWFNATDDAIGKGYITLPSDFKEDFPPSQWMIGKPMKPTDLTGTDEWFGFIPYSGATGSAPPPTDPPDQAAFTTGYCSGTWPDFPQTQPTATNLNSGFFNQKQWFGNEAGPSPSEFGPPIDISQIRGIALWQYNHIQAESGAIDTKWFPMQRNILGKVSGSMWTDCDEFLDTGQGPTSVGTVTIQGSQYAQKAIASGPFTANYSGTATDVTYTWTSPDDAAAVFATPNAEITTVTFSKDGTLQLQCSVQDENKKTTDPGPVLGSKSITVSTGPAPTEIGTISISGPTTAYIGMPSSAFTASFSGNAKTPIFQWISTPAGATFSSDVSASTTVTFAAIGNATLTCTITDIDAVDSPQSATSTQIVIENPGDITYRTITSGNDFNIVSYYGNSGNATERIPLLGDGEEHPASTCATIGGVAPSLDSTKNWMHPYINVLIFNFLQFGTDGWNGDKATSTPKFIFQGPYATEAALKIAVKQWKTRADPFGRNRKVLVSMGGQKGSLLPPYSEKDWATDVLKKWWISFDPDGDVLDGFDIDIENINEDTTQPPTNLYTRNVLEGFILWVRNEQNGFITGAPQAFDTELQQYYGNFVTGANPQPVADASNDKGIMKYMDYVGMQQYGQGPSSLALALSTTSFAVNWNTFHTGWVGPTAAEGGWSGYGNQPGSVYTVNYGDMDAAIYGMFGTYEYFWKITPALPTPDVSHVPKWGSLVPSTMPAGPNWADYDMVQHCKSLCTMKDAGMPLYYVGQWACGYDNTCSTTTPASGPPGTDPAILGNFAARTADECWLFAQLAGNCLKDAADRWWPTSSISPLLSPNPSYTESYQIFELENMYQITNHGARAELYLNIGIHAFDVFSHDGTLFAISTTEDGEHNEGTEYLTGVTRTELAPHITRMEINITTDSPSKLYYYNKNLSEMGGLLNVVNP